MKKFLLVLFSMLLTVSLCSCGERETVYTVQIQDISLTIDRENETISDGTYTYRYTLSRNSGGYSGSIRYPDGIISNFQNDESGSTSISGNGIPNTELYISSSILTDALLKKAPRKPSDRNFLPGLLLLAMGLFPLLAPEAAWKISWGWRYKNAEPSSAALVMERISGIIMIAAGILLFFL